jgi:DNA replicative helicase MCM subunit Mcm2 (Cdc46/Mcm family)
MKLADRVLGLRPLMGTESKMADEIEQLLPPADARDVKTLRKQLHVTFYEQTLGITLTEEKPFPLVRAARAGNAQQIQEYNTKVRHAVKQRLFKQFAPDAFHAIADHLAEDLPNQQNAKEAAALQLFCTEPLHILLLADQRAGAQRLTRDAARLAPIGAHATGSPGASHTLIGEYTGNTFKKGTLPQADHGTAFLDDLHLFREDARSAILTAMDKGQITYAKQGKHAKLDTRINVLATAAPRADKFIGDDLRGLKKQIPFDSKLLSKFHLTFVIRTPGPDGFAETMGAEKTAKGKPDAGKPSSRTPQKTSAPTLRQEDIDFLHDYITEARTIDVKFPSALNEDVIGFLKMLKTSEQKRLIELSPKLSEGLVTLAKASARMELRNIVSDIDLLRVKNIVMQSLEWTV